MSLKLVPIAILAVLAATVLPTPMASSYPNECVLTGANDPNGHPQSPPCLSTDALSAANVYGTLTASPACAPTDPLASRVCKPYYIFLIPDYDGDLSNGVQSETILWQENNNCPGLQRAGGAGCFGADARIL